VFCVRDIRIYLILRTIVPVRKHSLAQIFFLFFAAIMVLSGFGRYHGLFHKDAQGKHIIVTPTLGGMMHALGLG
jgi:hypothetical protein